MTRSFQIILLGERGGDASYPRGAGSNAFTKINKYTTYCRFVYKYACVLFKYIMSIIVRCVVFSFVSRTRSILSRPGVQQVCALCGSEPNFLRSVFYALTRVIVTRSTTLMVVEWTKPNQFWASARSPTPFQIVIRHLQYVDNTHSAV